MLNAELRSAFDCEVCWRIELAEVFRQHLGMVLIEGLDVERGVFGSPLAGER